MARQKTLQEAYEECKINGFFKDQEYVNKDKIKTMLDLSNATLEFAKKSIKELDKGSLGWSVIFKMHYDSLHQLIDIIVSFSNKKIANHQCLFAYLCKHHPELELSWDFFEMIRTKRNGVNYYGTPVSYEEWKKIEVQINLYISTLKKVVEGKLGK